MATKNDKEAAQPDKAASQTVGIDPAADVVVIGTGKGKHLKEGMKYPTKGADAILLIQSGQATLTTDK